MKLIQFHQPGLGKRIGIVTRDEEVIDVTSEEAPDVLQLLELAHNEGISVGIILADIQEKVSQKESLIKSPPYSQINHSCYEEAMKKVEQGFTFLIKWLWFICQ